MIREILSTFEHNPHYLDRYIKFVLKYSEQNVNNKNIERHHICPKAKHLFPQYKSFKENPWNLARLTYRQHYIAHWILSKVYTKGLQRSSVQKAFWNTSHRSSSHQDTYVSARLYAAAKTANSVAMKNSNPMKCKETKNKMKDSHKRFWESDRGYALRKQKSEMRTGRCDITEEGLERLSHRWLGVARPKTNSHINSHRRSISIGLFTTPFGDFDSPQHAADSEYNNNKLSRYQIDKRCKDHKDGFGFIPKSNTQTP